MPQPESIEWVPFHGSALLLNLAGSLDLYDYKLGGRSFARLDIKASRPVTVIEVLWHLAMRGPGGPGRYVGLLKQLQSRGLIFEASQSNVVKASDLGVHSGLFETGVRLADSAWRAKTAIQREPRESPEAVAQSTRQVWLSLSRCTPAMFDQYLPEFVGKVRPDALSALQQDIARCALGALRGTTDEKHLAWTFSAPIGAGTERLLERSKTLIEQAGRGRRVSLHQMAGVLNGRARMTGRSSGRSL